MYIDKHVRDRLIQRGFIPTWLSMQAANEFVLQRINRTVREVISEYDPGLIKKVTPGLTVYERRGRARTIVKNRVAVAQ